MKMIFVKPAEGFRILNPADGNRELPAAGATVPADPYWLHRQREGGVIISDQPDDKPAAKPAAKPATAAPKQ